MLRFEVYGLEMIKYGDPNGCISNPSNIGVNFVSVLRTVVGSIEDITRVDGKAGRTSPTSSLVPMKDFSPPTIFPFSWARDSCPEPLRYWKSF